MTDSGSDREDARGGPQQRPGGRRFDRNDNICFKWPQGNCPYGNRCRFIHDGPGGSTGGGGGMGRGRGGGTELFLRGLDYYMTKDEVRDEILQDLQCQEIILPQSRDNEDQNRGFAILKFKTETDARSAMDKINGTECRGRGLFVRWSEDFPPSQWDRGFDRGFGGGGGGRSNECFRWSREGRCEYGRECRFEHTTRGSGTERPRRTGGRYGGGGGRSDVCYAFQRDGKCSYGDSCKFIHE